MSQRIDTLLRSALLVAGGVALVAMFAVAGNDGLSRNTRFTLLVAFGGLVLVGWPGTALAQPYCERRPLRMKWGKPPQPDASQTRTSTRPDPIHPEAMPATFALDARNSLVAFGGSAVAAVVLSILAYAIAGSASSEEGGFLLFVGVAGAILLARRAVSRISTARDAVVVDDQGITLGRAIGYIPPLLIVRPSVAALETADGPEPKLVIVNDTGRRFEIRTDQLRGAGLPNCLADLWPEVPWRSPV